MFRSSGNSRHSLTAFFFKSVILKSRYTPDFISYADVIVELKTLSALSGVDDSQVLNYLKVPEGHGTAGRPAVELRHLVAHSQAPDRPRLVGSPRPVRADRTITVRTRATAPPHTRKSSAAPCRAAA